MQSRRVGFWTEPKRFAGGLDMRWERERGIKDATRSF